MTKVKDPVCGMMIDTDTAAGHTDYKGKTFYFCSSDCLRQFEASPAQYAKESASAIPPSIEWERHEPPYTKLDGMVAPKFGAAGSGGAEYELLPEAHDDKDAR